MIIFNTIRCKEWIYSKVPLMVVPFLIYMTEMEKADLKVALSFLQYTFFLMCFYAFGYVINNYCDIEVDKKSGKDNLFIEMSKVKAFLIVLFVFVTGFVIGCVNHFDIKTILYLTLIYLLGASYSMKPFRFKEQGVAGVIVSSFAQRCMPLIILNRYIRITWASLLLWMLLGFLLGLRYILIHQYIDFENDKKSGVSTYLTENKVDAKRLIHIVFVLEIIVCAVFVCLTSAKNIMIVITALYIVQMVLTYYTVEKIFKQSFWYSFICVPMEDYYNFYLPIIFMFKLVFDNKLWTILLVVFICLMFKMMKEKWKTALFILKCRRNKR